MGKEKKTQDTETKQQCHYADIGKLYRVKLTEGDSRR